MSRLRRSSLLITSLLLACTTFAHADHVNWSPDVETALRSANSSGRLVLMKFTADWCGYCKKMERETFTRPNVARTVNEQFVPVLVDADKHQGLVQNLKIKGLPALLVVSPDMVILSRITGYQTEEKLMPKLQAVLAQHSRVQQPESRVVGSSGFSPAPTRPVSSTQTVPGAAVATGPAAARPAVPMVKPAFGGLCLPAVSETRSLVSGRPDFNTKYRGKTLYFSSQQQMQTFLQKPDKYWPANDGNCPVTHYETGRNVEGKLEYAAMFRGKLWTTANAAAMKAFVGSPASYVDALTKR